MPTLPTVVTCTNTKTQLGPAALRTLLEEFAADAVELSRAGFVAFLPSPALPAAARILGPAGVAYGAQDVWPPARGHLTGEVTPDFLTDLGCTHVMVGHQERRRAFAEDDALVAAKAAACAEAGLVPVLCAGEDEPAGPDTAAGLVARQTGAVLAALDGSAPLVVMYEPAWTIGGSRPADPEHVAHVVGRLRELTADRAGPVRCLYGGAVTPGVYRRLRTAVPLDGLGLGRVVRTAGTRREVIGEVLEQHPAA